MQAFQQFHTHPGHAMAQRLQTRRQYGASSLGIKQFAQAATVKGVQMTRQGFDVLQRHRHYAGVAVAGGHAVDHAFLVQQRVEELRALGDALAVRGIVLQASGHLAVGQGQHVFDAQGAFTKGDGLKRRRHRSSRKGKS